MTVKISSSKRSTFDIDFARRRAHSDRKIDKENLPREVAVFPLARPTFDIDFAQARAESAIKCLLDSKMTVFGSKQLLTEQDELDKVLQTLDWSQVSLVLILQCSFCDASMPTSIAQAAPITTPLSIWAWPETRTGKRLRLNSFCGANLTAHALGMQGRALHFLYQKPELLDQDIKPLLIRDSAGPKTRPPVKGDPKIQVGATQVLRQMNNDRLALIGEHPAGFTTCAYDATEIETRLGIKVEKMAVNELFDLAKMINPRRIAVLHQQEKMHFPNLSELPRTEVNKAIALHLALQHLIDAKGYSAMAIRCWPEVFTDYGCALCSSMAHIADKGIPAACEADVYGALSSLLIQHLSGSKPWLVDIVDFDFDDNTMVVWHCGSAPMAMCADVTHSQATVHSNRRKALLREFALKPGTVTFARLSQAQGKLTMVLGSGEVLQRPKSFSGTSGVIRPALAAEQMADKIIGFGLEHHVSIVYAECKTALETVAANLGIEVLDLDEPNS